MKNKFIILGCGSSFGVPRADGSWGACDPKEKKNIRTRCSAFIKSDFFNILIDTSPDLRNQLISNKIKNIDTVIYTHMHGDQVHGINDLRIFSFKSKKKIPVYADYKTGKYLKKSFAYCFKNAPGYKAILKLNKLKNNLLFKKKGKSLSIKSFSFALVPAVYTVLCSKIHKSSSFLPTKTSFTLSSKIFIESI